ncbi:MAG TPA: rubredoxin [Sulfuriferula sp.]|nr:rubredoxin [Sulfuriferula sp.]
MNAITDTETLTRKWICMICDYVYDEARGIPEEGIAPGTRFEDIPDSWACPDCGVTKSDFELMQE